MTVWTYEWTGVWGVCVYVHHTHPRHLYVPFREDNKNEEKSLVIRMHHLQMSHFLALTTSPWPLLGLTLTSRSALYTFIASISCS